MCRASIPARQLLGTRRQVFRSLDLASKNARPTQDSVPVFLSRVAAHEGLWRVSF